MARIAAWRAIKAKLDAACARLEAEARAEAEATRPADEAKKAAYEKFKHPASGFALVGVFVSKRGADIRVAVTGAGANGVFRVKSFEEALKKRFSAKSIEGMTIPATGMNADIHASPEYRAHLVSVLAKRALAKAVA